MKKKKRQRNFFKRKGWRAKHNIWFRQKNYLFFLSWPFTCCDATVLFLHTFIYLFPGAIWKAAPRWRHVARRDDINTKRTFREGEKKRGILIHLRLWMCYIEVFFSLERKKKDGGWIMYLESSTRRGLNNQKKKRARLWENYYYYYYYTYFFFTCKEEKKNLFRSGRENLLAPKIWLCDGDLSI